MNTSQL